MSLDNASKKYITSEVQKNFKNLGLFSQQRSHLVHTAHTPKADEGIDGEVRLSDIGGTRKLWTKLAGTWYSVTVT